MTKERLSEINGLKARIEGLEEDIENFADCRLAYDRVEIIGRINGEGLGNADVLLNLAPYPKLMDMIKEYLDSELEKLNREFKEA